ncbi:MAG: demethoxyubiquinone hydroxylase family protein [Pseudomonadota bacterium]|nr:demethoxyubiquinone hydroxylase family protein [Pseudomonadota bacterium]
MQNDQKTIARILKVNHAGEHGAIRIYGAQLIIARRFYPDIVAELNEMRGHEIEHHKIFQDGMPSRNARPCRLLFLWAWGGWLLGFFTALLGRNMIWICTEAVEDAVHLHLKDQLIFLEKRDPDLYELIKTIQTEELSHLENAKSNQTVGNSFGRIALRCVAFITDMLIWMSTSGDSLRLSREMRTADSRN